MDQLNSVNQDNKYLKKVVKKVQQNQAKIPKPLIPHEKCKYKINKTEQCPAGQQWTDGERTT